MNNCLAGSDGLVASSELFTAMTQFLAISSVVFDISSLAVATELTCMAAFSTPAAILSVASSSCPAAEATLLLLSATW